MNIKPILFSTQMVQAILDGRKTMTRRVVKGLEEGTYAFDGFDDEGNGLFNFGGFSNGAFYDGSKPIKPRMQYNDILWVRETWREWAGGYSYKADAPEWACQWRPSIFMPKEAARIFLLVKDIRAERLADITEANAVREGFTAYDFCFGDEEWQKYTARDGFFHTWDNLNAKRGYPASSNPWVWVYSFERCDKPEGWCEAA